MLANSKADNAAIPITWKPSSRINPIGRMAVSMSCFDVYMSFRPCLSNATLGPDRTCQSRQRQENTMSSSKGTVLITGASSGIGAVYADRFAGRGHDLILVARNKERIAAVAARIAARHGVEARTIAADLTDRAGLADIEAVLESDASITYLVNNAGFGSAAPLAAAS